MSSSLPTDWYIGADNVVQLAGWQDAVNSTYLNAGTVTVTIKDLSGTEVSGITWPITMDYVAASSGIYRATIDKAISVSEGLLYFAEITASEGTIDDFYRIPLIAKYKSS